MASNIIALLYDCDLTLTPNYTEGPIFKKYGYNGDNFWKECGEESERQKKQLDDEPQEGYFKRSENICDETTYAHLLVKYAQEGKFPGLTLKELLRLGSEIEFHPGVPEFMGELSREFIKSKEDWVKHNISVEHYVLSCAIAQMLIGSKLSGHLSGLFATEFNENEKGINIFHGITYLGKTKFIYKINKGPGIDENCSIPTDLRRIPGQNMIYIGDGQSDVPCFATIIDKAGKAFAVYRENNKKSIEEVYNLEKIGRVKAVGPADYRKGSHTRIYLEQMIAEIADDIVEKTEAKISKIIGIHPKP